MCQATPVTRKIDPLIASILHDLFAHAPSCPAGIVGEEIDGEWIPADRLCNCRPSDAEMLAFYAAQDAGV